MKTLSHMACACLVAACLVAPRANATAYSTDVSDLWWVPTESGWGMQLVQEGSTVFATLFVYASSGQSTWAVATLQSHGQGSDIWSGPLYTVTGPWYGAVFDPSLVQGTQAGSMTFQLNTVSDGNLSYILNGSEVTKQVTRETLVQDDYTGNYIIGVHMQSSACLNPSGNGNVSGAMSLSINETGGSAAMTWTFLTGAVCTYSGPYTQSGKLGAISADYTCTNGEFGQINLFEMTNRAGMISARFTGQGTNTGCQYDGYFSGVDPSLPAQLD